MKLDCRGFEDRIDVLDAGVLPRQEQEAAEGHMKACPGCRRLAMAVRGESPPAPAALSADLTRFIMDSTSGSACPQAQSELCDCVDGILDHGSRELVSLHLASCPECRGLAAVLMELNQSLPEMAALAPDERFVEDVIALTSGRPAPVPVVRPRIDFREMWLRWIRRPRFAWEAAYVGAMLVLLILGNPAISTQSYSVPQLLLRNGDLWLHGTTSSIAGTREEARHSLDALKTRGRRLWGGATSLTVRSTSALREGAESILEGLKAGFAEAPPDRR
jgi:anti-sigma factor RsiW